MDLTTKDVADLLNLSNATIENWITQGTIPYYRIEDQYRFSRIEVEDWVLKKQSNNIPFKKEMEINATGSQQFSLYRAIYKGGVLHQVAGNTKQEVIRNAMKTIAKDLQMDPEIIAELLIDRENLQPTGLGRGIGLPHTRDSFIHSVHDRVVIAFPEKPINDYGALDGEPVHTLFFLFACNDKKHLHLLAKIAHLSHLEEAHKLLHQKPHRLNLLEYVKNWESHIGKTSVKNT